MQSFQNHLLQEDAVKAAKAKLKPMKGKEVSFTHQQSGKKITGTYQGMKSMGGRSYAHVETGKEAYRVPPHHIHQANEGVVNEATNHLTMVTHDGEEHHVIHGMAHNDANADKVRHAVGKAAAKHAGVSHADMEDDYSHYTHHEKADTPGAAGKIVTHKSVDAYVKHHAKSDADTYGQGGDDY